MTTAVDLLPRPHVAAAPVSAPDAAPDAFHAEQCRVLGHLVEGLAALGRKLIAISSAVGGDGKTTVSLGLARALAGRPDARVLLVDADLRRGRLAQQLGIADAAGAGLAGVAASRKAPLDAVVQCPPPSNLWLLPAGASEAAPYELLRSPAVGALLAAARESYDCVLVDTPPVVPVADVRALSQWVDGVILVVTAHRTPRELVFEALSAMEPEKLVGLVFNGDDQPLTRRYRAYYGYGEQAAGTGWRGALRWLLR
jgi:capsular exopolysaccharide synthesis family protein